MLDRVERVYLLSLFILKINTIHRGYNYGTNKRDGKGF